MTTRALPMLVLAGVLAVPAAVHARTVGCCLLVDVPDVTPSPRCLVVNLKVRPRRVSPRLVCRLAGGRPVRRGGCTCPSLERP